MFTLPSSQKECRFRSSSRLTLAITSAAFTSPRKRQQPTETLQRLRDVDRRSLPNKDHERGGVSCRCWRVLEEVKAAGSDRKKSESTWMTEIGYSF